MGVKNSSSANTVSVTSLLNIGTSMPNKYLFSLENEVGEFQIQFLRISTVEE
jgi:hypothetical protein